VKPSQGDPQWRTTRRPHRAASNNNTFTDNQASRNNQIGFSIYLSEQNTLTGKNASRNAGDGVQVADASLNRLSRNTANWNGGAGFSVGGTSELNTLDQNAACHNTSVDAADWSSGAGNAWADNLFCTTIGI
jgi:parallel beta-helix repeat protein